MTTTKGETHLGTLIWACRVFPVQREPWYLSLIPTLILELSRSKRWYEEPSEYRWELRPWNWITSSGFKKRRTAVWSLSLVWSNTGRADRNLRRSNLWCRRRNRRVEHLQIMREKNCFNEVASERPNEIRFGKQLTQSARHRQLWQAWFQGVGRAITDWGGWTVKIKCREKIDYTFEEFAVKKNAQSW